MLLGKRRWCWHSCLPQKRSLQFSKVFDAAIEPKFSMPVLGHIVYALDNRRGRCERRFLMQEEGPRRKSHSSKRNKKADKLDSKATWSQKPPSINTVGDEADIQKLGRDRRRKYLNEKILRDMAGVPAMTITN